MQLFSAVGVGGRIERTLTEKESKALRASEMRKRAWSRMWMAALMSGVRKRKLKQRGADV